MSGTPKGLMTPGSHGASFYPSWYRRSAVRVAHCSRVRFNDPRRGQILFEQPSQVLWIVMLNYRTENKPQYDVADSEYED